MSFLFNWMIFRFKRLILRGVLLMEPRPLREGKVVEIPLCTTGFKHHPKRWLFLGFS